jgi:hypothetical protein
MAFDVVLSAQFSDLFQQLNKLNDNLRQIQLLSRSASEQIQNDFKKSAGNTADFNNSVKTIGSVLASLNSSLSNLGAIGNSFADNSKQVNNFSQGLSTSVEQINFLANAVIEEAAQFNDASDSKQAALQKEVDALKQLQAASESNTNEENAKRFTDEISTQIIKVQELTQEIKKTTVPVQDNPFEESTKGVQQLRDEILKARADSEKAIDSYGKWSPEFIDADTKLKALEDTMRTLMTASSGLTVTGDTTGVNAVTESLKGATSESENLKLALAGAAEFLNELADAAIKEGSQFIDVNDKKQVVLQQEIQKLLQIQELLSASTNIEQQEKVTMQFAEQTGKVAGLVSELKAVPNLNPFEKAEEGAKTLSQQIRQARNEQFQLLNDPRFGPHSQEYVTASKRVAQLADAQDNLNKTAQAFNPEARLLGFTNVIKGALGGFQALSGALGLFGEDSKDVEKSLLRVQQLLLFGQGVNELLSLGTTFKALALQIGLTQEKIVETTVAQESFVNSSLKESQSLSNSSEAVREFADSSETAKEVITDLKNTKAADTVVTEINTGAQVESAAATEANVIAQQGLASSSAKSTVAQTQNAVAAEANAVAQGEVAVATTATAGAANIAASALQRLWLVVIANPLTATLAAFTALAGAVIYFSEQTDESTENIIKQNKSLEISLQLLNDIGEANTRVARERLEFSQNELKINQAQGTSSTILLQKELEISKQQQSIALTTIAFTGLTRAKVAELTDEYKDQASALETLKQSLITDPDNEEIKKQIEGQELVVKNLKVQLDQGEKLWKNYNDAVTQQAIKSAEIIKKTNEDILNSEKTNIEARLAVARAGTNEKTKTAIELANVEKGIAQKQVLDEIESLNEIARLRQERGEQVTEDQLFSEKVARQNLQSQLLKIENETQQSILKIKTDASIQAINDQLKIDQATLLNIQKGGEEELNLRLKIIRETSQAEIIDINKTAKEKEAILRTSEREQNELRKQFFANQIKESNEIEKQSILTELSVVQQGSEQELILKKRAVDIEANLQKQNAIDTITNTVLLNETLKRINTQADKEKEDLDKAKTKAGLERARDAAFQIIELENLKLEAQKDDPTTSPNKQIELQNEILKNQRIINELRLKTNDELFKKGIISEQEYQNTINDIQKAAAQNTIAISKNAADEQRLLVNELVGIYKTSFKNLFPGLDSEFDQLGTEFENLINKVNAGKFTLADGLEAAGKILGDFSAIISEGVNNQIKLLETQHEAALQQIDDIDNLISEKEDQIDEEEDLNKRGLANNLDLKRKELAELKKQKEAAIKNDEEIKNKQQELQRKQIAFDAITQASQLALAAAQILASFSSIPLGIGIAIAGGVIAGMYSIFENAKAKSAALSAGPTTNFETGGDIEIKEGRDYGVVKGRRHTQGGHRVEGTNLNIEDGEYLNHRKATEKYYKWLTGANKNSFESIGWQDIINLPGISFPELEEMKTIHNATLNTRVVNDISERKSELRMMEITNNYMLSKGTEDRIDALANDFKTFQKKYFAQPERHILPDGNYRIMEIDGNITKVISKNG